MREVNLNIQCQLKGHEYVIPALLRVTVCLIFKSMFTLLVFVETFGFAAYDFGLCLCLSMCFIYTVPFVGPCLQTV